MLHKPVTIVDECIYYIMLLFRERPFMKTMIVGSFSTECDSHPIPCASGSPGVISKDTTAQAVP